MLKNLNILIVEDDLSFALELIMLVKEIGYNVIAQVDNSAEALEIIMEQHPDLVLMDIDIKGRLNGLEVAEQVRHLNIPILFITSYAEEKRYEKSKALNALGYLVKPVGKYALISTIDLAIKATSNQLTTDDDDDDVFSKNDNLFFKKGNIFQRVPIAEIATVQASGDYTITQTDDEQFISSIRLNEFDDLLQNNIFMKVHRSYIVNLKKATSIDFEKNKIFINDIAIPFSRRIKTILMKKIRMIK